MKLPVEKSYDAIVIGSGIGGLAVASLLSRIGKKRVLVLERHFKAGGFTHIFKRHDYLWDVGIHYIGGMQEGGMLRHLTDFITDGKVQWQPMANPFERFVYPGLTFDVYHPEERFRSDLIARFPDEKAAIEQYFDDVKKMAGWFGMHVTMKNMPPLLEKIASPLRSAGIKSALMTTGEYMDTHFRDPALKAVLTSQWGDYGLPPSRSAFVIHALIVTHYFDGGFYPVGGSGTIAASIIPSIKEQGGEVLLCHEVRDILMKDGRACGVRAMEIQGNEEKGEHEFFAPVIISDAGAHTTYTRLLRDHIPETMRAEVDVAYRDTGLSNLTLYVGLNDSPEKLGVKGENYWIYTGFDHEDSFARRNEILEGRPAGAYISFPSLKDAKAHKPTAEIICFVDYEPFKKWSTQPWKNRDEEYQKLKSQLTESMLEFAERHIPGFRSLVSYTELSTPVTNEHFANHAAGQIYGIPCTPDRFRRDWMGVRTPVDGVYLTGADASSPGFAGALMGGYGAAAVVLGLRGLPGLLRSVVKS